MQPVAVTFSGFVGYIPGMSGGPFPLLGDVGAEHLCEQVTLSNAVGIMSK